MEVKVKTEEIRALMADSLNLRGITGEDAAFIIDDYVEAEQEGHKTHGLSKFLMVDAGLSRKKGNVEVVKKSGCFARIEGNGSWAILRPGGRRTWQLTWPGNTGLELRHLTM